MTPNELKKQSQIIDESVSFIEAKTEEIWSKFEEIDGCLTNECNEQRDKLKEEMNDYINKLKNEEKMIDQFEEMLHNTGNE